MTEKLKQIMSNIFEINEDEVTDESSIDNVENWDSLRHLDLILSIEETFNVSVSEEEMVEMISFADIKHILRDKGIKI